MARVSQEHLDARRRQILDGAARCFSRNGFHATSMQDVLKEVDLSAGAVYRYFGGKDELIAAIVNEVLTGIRNAFEEAARQTPPPPPDVLVGWAMDEVLGMGSGGPKKGVLTWEGEGNFPRLMVQVWTETMRNEELAAVMRDGFAKVRATWTKIVEGYQEAGMMRADIPADHVARTMIATAQGFAAQQALFGSAPVEVIQDGLRALMSVEPPRSGPSASAGPAR